MFSHQGWTVYIQDLIVDSCNLSDRGTSYVSDLIGFDFHAIEDPQSPWVVKYEGISKAMFESLFLVFPILEQRFMWAFPERQKRHREMQEFLSMLDQVIAHKRKVLGEEQDANVSEVPESEKDLLTLMIESENNGEGTLTNEELKVQQY